MRLTTAILALIPLASANLRVEGSELCITGCCGFNLQVQMADLTSAESANRMPLGKMSIPCCNCTTTGPMVSQAEPALGSNHMFPDMGSMGQKPMVGVTGQATQQPLEPHDILTAIEDLISHSAGVRKTVTAADFDAVEAEFQARRCPPGCSPSLVGGSCECGNGRPH